MGISSKTRANLHMSSRQVKTMLVHIFFFWMRLSACLILYGETYNDNPDMVRVRIIVEDITYSFVFNLCALYIALQAIVHENIYKYIVALLFQFHNGIITIIIPILERNDTYNFFWGVYTIITVSYVLEFVAMIFILYIGRNENSIQLFQKIGANPEINNAFAARKKLETLNELNIFFSTIVIGRFWFPDAPSYRWFITARYLNTLTTYVDQLFISVNFNEEDVTQRKVAIYLTIFDICFPIGFIIWQFKLSRQNFALNGDFYKIVFVDILIIKIVLLVFLINDYKLFGSGLKEYLKFKAKRLTLSTNIKMKSDQ